MSSHKASIGFIFITILIDVIGIGIIIPVIPALLDSMLGTGMSDAAKYGGMLIFTFAFMQFLFAPVLGTLSDKFGRRPVLLLALLGLGFDFLIHALAPTLIWLFVGRVLAGIFGASFTVASAYIADISAPEKKAQNFGIMGAAFGLGFIIGPLIGGVCAQWGVRVPFFVAAGLSFLNFIYGYFILPESLSKEKRREIDWKRINPVASIMKLKRYGGVIGLALAFFLAQVAAQSLQSTWTFYTIMKFDWHEDMVGYSLAVVGVVVAIVQGGLIRHIVKFFGQRKTVYIGFFLWTLGMFLFAFAGNQWLLLLYIIPYCVGGIAGPTVQSIVSNKVPDNQQGELQGALTSLISVAAIIGPIAMTAIFYFFTNDSAVIYFPGAPFFLGGLLMMLAWLMAHLTLKQLPEIK